jgi:hypothetical protein
MTNFQIPMADTASDPLLPIAGKAVFPFGHWTFGNWPFPESFVGGFTNDSG